MAKKSIKSTDTEVKPNTFTINGIEYKMVGVNDDGSPILKSLDAIKEEERINNVKQRLVNTVYELAQYMKVDVSIAANQVGIEIHDEFSRILFGNKF